MSISKPILPLTHSHRHKRRQLPFLPYGFLIFIISLFFLHRQFHSAHHLPFQPPNHGTVVHGKVVHDKPNFIPPGHPFPHSPMTGPASHTNETQPWLVAVICAASETERRMMIRSSWMQLYKDVPFDGRFVVSHPGQWSDVVAQENRTFGDMIVLDWLAEDDITANTVKTLEFYKWLTLFGQKYQFVTKMDTDLWLNARLFWDKYLQPMMPSLQASSRDSEIRRTVIGELYYASSWDLAFPHGAMYTVTWDMVGLLAALQARYNVVTGEDMAVASLMLQGQETANFINFRGFEKFDYDDRDSRGDGTAWARTNTHPNAIKHAVVDNRTIAVHNLKTQDQWFKVAALFNKNGVIAKPPPSQPDRTPWSLWLLDLRAAFGWPSYAHMSRFDRIPDFLWDFKDGNWVCDGIWRLGATKTGYL